MTLQNQDVDATGMSFDDYDPAKPTPMAQDVANRIDNMAWIARTLGVVIGSEDGHAVANRPIAFAHGMQTSGFGWRDPDMRTNRASPYFLGRWYPSYQPEVFFKPAAIEPKYRALYFDPARRLPLFQAAFHDSVITTHHWTLDSLKFTETRVTTELLQQLYNVPPLVNLSLDSLPLRLPVLQRLDAFFRPLHQRLWNRIRRSPASAGSTGRDSCRKPASPTALASWPTSPRDPSRTQVSAWPAGARSPCCPTAGPSASPHGSDERTDGRRARRPGRP